MSDQELKAGSEVRHQRFGNGLVEFTKDKIAFVRFAHGIESCDIASLRKRTGLSDIIDAGVFQPPIEVIAKAQALSIQSVNDAWGVFSRSKINLLPHQLWVCNRVLRQWPIRQLVADDVGLGKTIEAGLILWPLLSKGMVKRLLVLCPASLVEQWQYRMRDMFDIRLAKYTNEADTKRSGFWGTHNQVVASLSTLRADSNGRHDRMLEADNWDLLIIDEAHHLNADEHGGVTLGYRFVEKLLNNKKVDSCIFFTGTPHRGKSYGFWSLMKLLRPDLFDPEKPDAQQIPHLREVLIRNNKSLVTDMQGEKLFKPVQNYPETYFYNEEEEDFYRLLTGFIESGKAYASNLTSRSGNQVMLVLISMQKLASSSVAAIRLALKRRLARMKDLQEELQKGLGKSKQNRFNLISQDDDLLLDMAQELDDMLAEQTIMLMEEEIPNLESLVEAADLVINETKIEKILDVLNERFKDRQVLFFTEYKATQSSLMSALMTKFGEECVTFINGDEYLHEVLLPNGQHVSKSINRADAADLFNEGKVRFLISTEAGGEGIDLQDKCYSLIHVDLPWNPMRLHQRVGRLNRYGQQYPVEVITMRNPHTVESRIWDKLNSKLESITKALGSAMDDPEDLLQLVLGMTSSNVFSELFSQANSVKVNRLDKWFDEKTASFGGETAIDTVKDLVGNASKFDLRGLKGIPNADLPMLQPFFLNMLGHHRRRVKKDDDGGLTFKTPDMWQKEIGVQVSYKGLVFNRDVKGRLASEKVIGVGHKVFDQALRDAVDLHASYTFIESFSGCLLVFQIYDEITEVSGNMRQAVVGIYYDNLENKNKKMLSDAELLEELNQLRQKDLKSNKSDFNVEQYLELINDSTSYLQDMTSELALPFNVPNFRPISLIIGGNNG